MYPQDNTYIDIYIIFEKDFLQTNKRSKFHNLNTNLTTVNSEFFFSRVVISRIALKDIFAKLRIRGYGMIYLY